MYEYTVAVLRHTRRELWIPFTDGCEPPCGYWELNLGPLFTPVNPAYSGPAQSGLNIYLLLYVSTL